MRAIEDLGLPGVIDIHTHFMPDSVMAKVWEVFDRADQVYGMPWDIGYRVDQQSRLQLLRDWGVKAFTAMVYAHKPGMSAWLNDWAAEFAQQTPDCLHTATFFPEIGVERYVNLAVSRGARVFKIHLQVGAFDPRDPLLDSVWGGLSEAGIPTVVHCGSGPIAGPFTGPGPIGEVLRRHPRLQIIIAHMGAPQYSEFLALSERYPNVRLDTTMAFTEFMEHFAPFPAELRPALLEAGLRGDVLFGSDFPNIPYVYSDAIDSLVGLEFGDEWLRSVLWNAAAELFGIADSGGDAGDSGT